MTVSVTMIKMQIRGFKIQVLDHEGLLLTRMQVYSTRDTTKSDCTVPVATQLATPRLGERSESCFSQVQIDCDRVCVSHVHTYNYNTSIRYTAV